MKAVANLDPELLSLVELARERAVAAKEFGPFKPLVAMPELPKVAGEALLDWVRSGEYREATKAIGAADPDLADQ